MKILTKEEVSYNKDVLYEVIKNGVVFIHPTDTIYGLGCNAEINSAVEHIRKLKLRPKMPFSVIAPSKKWIRENCSLTDEAEKWLRKLPGQYTLILRAKDGIAMNVAPGLSTIGVRIPDHWFSEIICELGIPVVTTSANKSGEDFMTSLENLDKDIEGNIEFIVYEGEKHGRPSTIVDLTGKKARIIER